MQHKLLLICKVCCVVSAILSTAPSQYVLTVRSASPCGPDNNDPYLSAVCPVSPLVYSQTNPSLLPCLSSVSWSVAGLTSDPSLFVWSSFSSVVNVNTQWRRLWDGQKQTAAQTHDSKGTQSLEKKKEKSLKWFEYLQQFKSPPHFRRGSYPIGPKEYRCLSWCYQDYKHTRTHLYRFNEPGSSFYNLVQLFMSLEFHRAPNWSPIKLSPAQASHGVLLYISTF